MKLSSRISRSGGFTLLELIISMSVLTLAVGVVIYAYITIMNIFTSELSASDLSYQASKAMDRLSKELRGDLQIISATSGSISFWYTDLNSNGTLDANEQVTYYQDITNEVIDRTQGSTTEMIAKYIKIFSLAYDSTVPNIKRVTISITAGNATDRSTLESSVKLRNL